MKKKVKMSKKKQKRINQRKKLAEMKSVLAALEKNLNFATAMFKIKFF